MVRAGLWISGNGSSSLGTKNFAQPIKTKKKLDFSQNCEKKKKISSFFRIF